MSIRGLDRVRRVSLLGRRCMLFGEYFFLFLLIYFGGLKDDS